jgi:hypothetical protein
MKHSAILLMASGGCYRGAIVAPGSFMIHALAILVTLGGLCLQLQAGERFLPPSAHPVERYEPGWKKNPFTLKTAPLPVEVQSFAKDLAIGSMYQVGNETTVVVVNTKTRERTILRNGDSAGNGMRVKLASIKDTRKESSAIVELGGQEATLRYDTSYLKQIAAARTTAGRPHEKSAGQTAANARVDNMPAPHPPNPVSYNLDADPGDNNKAAIENNTGTYPEPSPAPAPYAPPAISTNLDAEPVPLPPVSNTPSLTREPVAPRPGEP